jgi:hypothetical protein
MVSDDAVQSLTAIKFAAIVHVPALAVDLVGAILVSENWLRQLSV